MADQMGIEIVQQVKQKELGADGQLHWVWHITYKTSHGTTSHVEIPAEEYTAENVAAAIENELQHIDAVHRLT